MMSNDQSKDIYIGFSPRELKLLDEILTFPLTCAPGSNWKGCGTYKNCDQCEFTELLDKVREKVSIYV